MEALNLIKEYYSDKENCYRDLGIARQIFSNIRTTLEQYERMEFMLSLMYLYCPKEVKFVAEAMITESEFRKAFLNLQSEKDT